MLFPSKALTFVVGLALISETEFARESRSGFFTPLFVFRHRIGRLLVKIVELLVLPLSVLTVRREFDGVLRHPAFGSFL